MATIGFAEAFAKYKAKLKNVQWSVCAINAQNELIVSLWAHHRDKSIKEALVFKDSFDRWSGPGNNEFRDKVTNAFTSDQTVRLIIVSTEKVAQVQDGDDASTLKKRFAVRSDLIGKVTEVDGSNYTFRFIKATKPR